jgi:long-subunit acyl-CoA synthetase (AMP-forming)
VIDAEFARLVPEFQSSIQTLSKIVYIGDSPIIPSHALHYSELATVEFATRGSDTATSNEGVENKTGFAMNKSNSRGSAGVYFDGDELMESMSGRGDDVYGLFYTSGTMGRAKGVMLTHNNVLCNAYGVIEVLHIKTSSRYLHAAPMFHAADACNTFAVVMGAGQHCFVRHFDPRG